VVGVPAPPELFDVAVSGGALRVARWPGAGPAVLAAHGITASHACWATVAAHLAGAVTLIAVDHRGRGGSGCVPGPYGMATHARDLLAVADHLGLDQVVIAGHSMGGFVAAATAVSAPERVRGLVLVDGGLPGGTTFPAADVAPDHHLEQFLGPALQRLRMTYPTREAYRHFWRAHPAFGPYWGPAAEAYVDYDLGGQPPELRSKASEAAVRADIHDLFTNIGASAAAEQVDCPVIFLRATRGMFDDPPGIYPPDAVATVTTRASSIEAEDVPDTNHYTILLSARPAAVVANRIRALAT
jgi:pimeloyl-ACP methyl ester carboxylesterase